MRWLLLVMMLVPLSGASSAQQRVPAPLEGVRKIVCLGDSITEAAGAPGGYVWLLQRYLSLLYPQQRIEVVNAGVSGNRAPDMEARFTRDVLLRKPDLITINVGTNDVWHGFREFAAGVDHPKGDLPAGVPLAKFRASVRNMVVSAQKAGARVMLVSPAVIGEDLARPENARLVEYVNAMRALAREHGCLFVDLHHPFREILTTYQRHAGKALLLLTSDGVHLDPRGYRVMAHAILRGLGVPDSAIATLQVGG